MTRVTFTLDSRLSYTNKTPAQSPLDAVTRSIARRLKADVTLWYSDRRGTLEVYTCKWFDASTDCFCECEVTL